MMKKVLTAMLAPLLCLFALSACAVRETGNGDTSSLLTEEEQEMQNGDYTAGTRTDDVISDPVFGSWGRLIFPVDEWYYNGDTLGSLSMTWYTHIDPDMTVQICNYLREHTLAGEQVFYLSFATLKIYSKILKTTGEIFRLIMPVPVLLMSTSRE